jgi:hypothetical protein
METKIEKHLSGLAPIGTIVFTFQNLKKDRIVAVVKNVAILSGIEVFFEEGHGDMKTLGVATAIRQKFSFQSEDNTLSLVVYYSIKVQHNAYFSKYAREEISKDIDGIAKTIGAALAPFDQAKTAA